MTQQLSVFIQNEPGKIAAVTRALAGAGVDIRALSIADTADFGVLRMLVSDIAVAQRVLSEHSCIVSATGVTVVSVPDAPGGLAQLLTLLDRERVDIEYLYSLIGHDTGKAYMVFRAVDGERFKAVLDASSIDTVSAAELGLR